jgi:hypothetical protein
MLVLLKAPPDTLPDLLRLRSGHGACSRNQRSPLPGAAELRRYTDQGHGDDLHDP